MSNIFRLFCYDIKHLFGNVITVIIVLGLVFLPSIFTWYNVLACWDVFNNTGQLEVAVANCDAGYKDNVLPTEINVGSTVESALRANSQINWVFTSEDDAVDGAASGKYYAAIVIPENFSENMLSFYSKNTEHAEIIYYENEKKNAVAPRVTDQASTQVSSQINTTFAETLSNAALGVMDNLSQASSGSGAVQYATKLSNLLSNTATELNNIKDVLNSYANLTSAANQFVISSNALLGQAKTNVSDASEDISANTSNANTIKESLEETKNAIDDALSQNATALETLVEPTQNTISAADGLSGSTSATLHTQAAYVQDNINTYKDIAASLEAIRDLLPAQHQSATNTAINHVNKTIEKLEILRDTTNSAADKIDGEVAGFKEKLSTSNNQISNAKTLVSELKTNFEINVRPAFESLGTQLESAVDMLSSRTGNIDAAAENLTDAANIASNKLDQANGTLNNTAQKIEDAANKLSALATSINDAANKADESEIKNLIQDNPQALAQALATPVETQRIAVFAANDFGSAMAPLYATLALWVGALLALVLFSAQVSARAQSKLKNTKSWQVFFGRFGVIAVVLLMQSTVLGLGNILFLGIQVQSPLLYMLACWVGSLAFGFMIYTLVSLFANLGKAIAVLVLIMQIGAAGGSFPLQLLPGVFEAVNPFMPATHIINAMRSAQFGQYNNDFWFSLTIELCFTLPFIVLGLLRPVLVKATDWFVEQVEKSKLIT